MKKYIDHLHARPVHEKREFAVHAAAAVIALVFLVWISTLGIRFLGSNPETTVADTSSSAASLIAATAAAGASFQSQLGAGGAPNTTGSADGNTDNTPPAPAATSPATIIGAPNDPATSIMR